MQLGAAVGQVILNVPADEIGDGTVWTLDPEPGLVFGDRLRRPFSDARTAVSERDAFHHREPSAFSLSPPPALTARDYQRVFDEVKSIGRDTSATRRPIRRTSHISGSNPRTTPGPASRASCNRTRDTTSTRPLASTRS